MLPQGVGIMIAAVGGLLLFFFLVMSLSNRYNLNNIKDKTVGHGQHGTAHRIRLQDNPRALGFLQQEG